MKREMIDASGRPGAQGQSGKSYSSTSTPNGSGRMGGSGGAGGVGEEGQPGGAIEAQVSLQKSQSVVIQGKLNDRPFSVDWDPSSNTTVFLNARGGDGGRGGPGGRGQNGSRGSRGSNATRYSSGGNGGSGGRGGRGGASGSGGAAGAGGEVKLKIPFEDSDLLVGLDWNVSAGTPGDPGTPGSGGAGGPGGAGGSSYSWTETEYYTDSEGKSQSRTVYRSNPGGSTGPSGASGQSGPRGSRGRGAPDGKFTLETEHGAYTDRYRLKCLDFELLSGDGNDIFEFGERSNVVRQMVVQNQGPAPSPPQHLVAEMAGSAGVLTGGELHPIPTLHSRSNASLADFTFALEEAPAHKLPVEHGVLKERVTLTARSWYPRVSTYDLSFELCKQIEVTFPVEMVTAPASTSVAKDRDVWQEWTVHNRSNKPFPTPGRELWFDLTKSGATESLAVYNAEGVTFLEGEQKKEAFRLPVLRPGGTFVFSARLRATEQAVPYTKASLTAELRLTPQAGGEPRLIQRNLTQYNIASVHLEREADVVLMTHHGCSATEVKGWFELFETLGLRWDIWDVSLYGEFPVRKLAKRLPGCLLVVLNSGFLSPRREEVSPLDLLDFREFRQALSQEQISFYFVGESCEILNHLVPQPKKDETFSSITSYLKGKEFQRNSESEVPPEMTEVMDKISISQFYVRGVPQPKVLEQKGKKLLAKLKKKCPQRRFLVTTIFQPGDDEGWLRNKHCGVLEVRHLPDRNSRSVVVREVYRETAQSPAFLNSEENLLGLFSAFSWSRKRQLLERLGRDSVSEQQKSELALADAIMMDLYEEQFDLRKVDVRLSKRGLQEALNLTTSFCALDLRAKDEWIEPDSPLGRALIRIAAGLEFTADHQIAWWDHRIRFLGGTTDVEITVFLRKIVDQFLDRNFGPDRIFGTKPIRKLVDELCLERSKELEAEQNRLVALAESKLDKKEAAREVLVRWELRDYLKSESGGESALWTQVEMEALKESELQHSQHLAELHSVYRDALAWAKHR